MSSCGCAGQCIEHLIHKPEVLGLQGNEMWTHYWLPLKVHSSVYSYWIDSLEEGKENLGEARYREREGHNPTTL